MASHQLFSAGGWGYGGATSGDGEFALTILSTEVVRRVLASALIRTYVGVDMIEGLDVDKVGPVRLVRAMAVYGCVSDVTFYLFARARRRTLTNMLSNPIWLSY